MRKCFWAIVCLVMALAGCSGGQAEPSGYSVAFGGIGVNGEGEGTITVILPERATANMVARFAVSGEGMTPWVSVAGDAGFAGEWLTVQTSEIAGDFVVGGIPGKPLEVRVNGVAVPVE